MTNRRTFRPSVFLWALAAALTWALAVTATESVVVVVNKNSWSSRTIANHYIALRQVPVRNVIFLDYRGSADRIALEEFRRQILDPVLSEIEKRKLGNIVTSIAYSADFPYRIDFSHRAPMGATFTDGSLTGLTFHAPLLDDPGLPFANFNAVPNRYAAEAMQAGQSKSFRNFRSGIQNKSAGLGKTYLSTMLGYTSGRGNSLAEVTSMLRRAAVADGSHPLGTFVFMENSDIRSKARSSNFLSVVSALKAAGFRAETQSGTVPTGNMEICGAMLGSSDFTWDTSAKILPGAICENFTSYGGILAEHVAQTPLSALVRAGAAGTSGTVVEPYAIPHKFPHPMIHVHYARGCTMAEAFYQSVAAPYQLLIVGDPQCRPWGILPTVDLVGIEEGNAYRGDVTITPTVTTAGNLKVTTTELYLDEQPLAKVRPGQSFRLDTTRYPDGYHRLTVVARDDSPLTSAGRRHVHVAFDNGGGWVDLSVEGNPDVPSGTPMTVHVNAAGCQRVSIRSNGVEVGALSGSDGNISIDTSELGLGPVTLEAYGYRPGDSRPIRSIPLELQIKAPPLIAARNLATVAAGTPGVLLQRDDGTRHVITDTAAESWLETAGVASNGTFVLRGNVTVPSADLYQFRAELTGSVRLVWNGRVRYVGSADELAYGIPLHLAAGQHDFVCEVRLKGPPRAQFRFGNRGAQTLGAGNSHCFN